MMRLAARGSRRLLVLNPSAGSIDEEVERRLEVAFPDHEVLRVPLDRPLPDAWQEVAPPDDAEIIAAGGDGTISAVVRCVRPSQTLGIIATGTFNNFARSLGLPVDLEEAVRVIRTGHPRPVALGEADGHVFLEAAAVGIFGDALALGEAVKDQDYPLVRERLATVAGQGPFHYRISGSLERSGRTFTIIVANTPSTGSRLPLGDKTPREPQLQLAIRGGDGRLRAMLAFAAGVLRGRDRHRTYRISEVRIEAAPAMHVYADLQWVGDTPVTIRVRPDALRVILPA